MAATEPAARPQPDALPPDEVLARDRARAPRAGFAALLAAVFVIGSGIALQAIYADLPRVPLIDALRDAAGLPLRDANGHVRPGLLTDKVLFFDHKAVPLILASVAQALGALCMGYVLVSLFDAIVRRGARVPRLARLGAMFGAITSAVAAVATQVALSVLAHNFATSRDQSTQAAHDVLRSGALVALQFIGLIGTLVLAVSVVLIALNAMRAGLLTRFLGIIGVFVGILTVIPIGSPVPIVQAFWLAAVGMLFLGRWPSGMPPAWTTGRAVPWPSQQELREQRERARGGGGDRAADGQASHPELATPEPSAATSRKKRKRRG